jgi:hypothetical protein
MRNEEEEFSHEPVNEQNQGKREKGRKRRRSKRPDLTSKQASKQETREEEKRKERLKLPRASLELGAEGLSEDVEVEVEEELEDDEEEEDDDEEEESLAKKVEEEEEEEGEVGVEGTGEEEVVVVDEEVWTSKIGAVEGAMSLSPVLILTEAKEWMMSVPCPTKGKKCAKREKTSEKRQFSRLGIMTIIEWITKQNGRETFWIVVV